MTTVTSQDSALLKMKAQVHRAGCAVTSMVEMLHEGDFRRDKYENSILHKIIEEVQSPSPSPFPFSRPLFFWPHHGFFSRDAPTPPCS